MHSHVNFINSFYLGPSRGTDTQSKMQGQKTGNVPDDLYTTHTGLGRIKHEVHKRKSKNDNNLT